MGGSDGCRNDTLLIVWEWNIGGSVSGTLGPQRLVVRGTLGLQTGPRCMGTTIRSTISSSSSSVNNPRIAYIWMYVCWAVHPDTYLDIWVGRVIIIYDSCHSCYASSYDSWYDSCYDSRYGFLLFLFCTPVMTTVLFASLILYAWITVVWDKGI